ncbi:hypothetical protein ACS6ZC_05655 [Streptococcus suis]
MVPLLTLWYQPIKNIQLTIRQLMEKQLPLTPSMVLADKWQHHQLSVTLLVTTTQVQQVVQQYVSTH